MHLLELHLVFVGIFLEFLAMPLIEFPLHLVLPILNRPPRLRRLLHDLLVELLYFSLILFNLSGQFLNLYSQLCILFHLLALVGFRLLTLVFIEFQLFDHYTKFVNLMLISNDFFFLFDEMLFDLVQPRSKLLHLRE